MEWFGFMFWVVFFFSVNIGRLLQKSQETGLIRHLYANYQISKFANKMAVRILVENQLLTHRV